MAVQLPPHASIGRVRKDAAPSRSSITRRRLLHIGALGVAALISAACRDQGTSGQTSGAGTPAGPAGERSPAPAAAERTATASPPEAAATASSTPREPSATATASEPSPEPTPAATATESAAEQRRRQQQAHAEGKLLARPGVPAESLPPGTHPLGLEPQRDGLLYVPAGHQSEQPAPLVLMLHGAGGNAGGGLAPFMGLADAAGLILLAVDSRESTWDIIAVDRYGPDVEFIDRALEFAFNRCAVAPGALAVAGFSDGASYALSLGLTNGDLFGHVIAFSPGFMAPASREGSPAVYISHGVHDTVLPIDRCSRVIVPRLREAGYDVHYTEFDGPHTVPPEIAQEAADWFAGSNTEGSA